MIIRACNTFKQKSCSSPCSEIQLNLNYISGLNMSLFTIGVDAGLLMTSMPRVKELSELEESKNCVWKL